MQYILICEIPFPSTLEPGRSLHTRRLTRDQVIAAIKQRWNNVEQCLALLDACSEQEGAYGHHYGVPVELNAGPHKLHVEGKMDMAAVRLHWPCHTCGVQGKGCIHRIPLEWVDSAHVCSPRCHMGPYRRTSQTHFAVK